MITDTTLPYVKNISKNSPQKSKLCSKTLEQRYVLRIIHKKKLVFFLMCRPVVFTVCTCVHENCFTVQRKFCNTKNYFLNYTNLVFL